MNLEIWLEALVAVLLAVTVVYCYVLNRRLASLRGGQDEMMALMDQFTDATRNAEASVSDLKAASQDVGADLSKKIEAARALSDELAVMTQSGDDLAGRLERAISTRPGGGDTGGEQRRAEGPRSESERELLEALKRAR